MPEPSYSPTDVIDELFCDEMGTSWIVKSDRTPSREAARAFIASFEGTPYVELGCRTVQARIEWREGEGWWLTLDKQGEYEVWEVYGRG